MCQHWDEVQPEGPGVPFDPDWEGFFQLELHGRLAVLTVRDAGVMVGYLSAIVAPRLHRKGWLEATVDAIFLSTPYRRGMLGLKLFKMAEAQFKAGGVKRIRCSAPARLAPLMRRLGYEDAQMSWKKGLDDG